MNLAVDQIMRLVRQYWVEHYQFLLEARIENIITIEFGPQDLPKIQWERKQTLSAVNDAEDEAIQSIILDAALVILEDALEQFMKSPNNLGRLQVRIRRGTCETIQC